MSFSQQAESSLEGEQSTLERFIASNEAQVFRFLRGLVGSSVAAEHLMERSFIATLRAEVLKAPMHEGRIVLFRSAFRAAKEYLTSGLLSPNDADASSSSDENESVEEAIRRLPFDYRAGFLLRDVLSFSKEDTGHVLGLQAEEVHVMTRRARLMVRRLFLRLIINENYQGSSTSPVQLPLLSVEENPEHSN